MIISNRLKPFGYYGLYKNIQRFQGLTRTYGDSVIIQRVLAIFLLIGQDVITYIPGRKQQ